MYKFTGHLGLSGQKQVFLGFASARDLCKISFADLLDETTHQGYQRPFSREHSLEFKRYILSPEASSLPLTFNLRTNNQNDWSIEETNEVFARLCIKKSAKQTMAQVDGQHRLGFMADSPIIFPFMTYIGLSVAEEMEIFRAINGKARGLSSSLLDFTEAQLLGSGLSTAKPELYVALQLNELPDSPWYGRLDMGGQSTVGNKRIASLRTMQHAVKRMTRSAGLSKHYDALKVTKIAIAFWQAIKFLLPDQWAEPRKHMLAKGIGVYALMSLAGKLINESSHIDAVDTNYFITKLSDFIDRVDWSNSGALRGYGGSVGADAALQMLIAVRNQFLQNFEVYAK